MADSNTTHLTADQQTLTPPTGLLRALTKSYWATHARFAEQLRMLTAMNYVARGVQVVAELGLADAVGEEPVSIPMLAAETQTRPDELGRVLRLLAAYEVFTVEGDGIRVNSAA